MKRSRFEVVKLAQSWIGKKESDGSHREIIDIYNSYSPLPRNLKMQYDWAWCAATWSALAIKLGYTDIMPIEMSCGYLIDKAIEMGCWVENDDYIPKPGDAIPYDWQDSGNGDNVGWPDHVGVIEKVNAEAGYFVVIEGNYQDSVKRRTMSINGRYIRGFITPAYDCDWEEGPNRTSGKDLKTIAREVIAGDWANGEERKKLLSEYGYDPETVQKKVNQILNGDAYMAPEMPVPGQPFSKRVSATCNAYYRDDSLADSWKTTANLYCRNDSGTNKKALCLIPKGTVVKNYGFFNLANGAKWLLVQVVLGDTLFTGFCHSGYLTRA